MADYDQESAREHLTEREREALKILAREMVRKAGLVRAPEKEAAEKQRKQFIEDGREYYKALTSYSKDMATLSGATLVGVTVVTKAFIPKPDPAWLLYASLGLLFVATLSFSLELYRYTAYVRKFSWTEAPPDTDDIAPDSYDIESAQWQSRRVQRGHGLLGGLREFWNMYWIDREVGVPSLFYYAGLACFVLLFIDTYRK